MIFFVNRIVSLVDERREERREEEDVGAAGRVGAGSRAGHGDGDAAGGPRGGCGGREAVLLDLDVGAGGAVDDTLQLGELVDLEALQSSGPFQMWPCRRLPFVDTFVHHLFPTVITQLLHTGLRALGIKGQF